MLQVLMLVVVVLLLMALLLLLLLMCCCLRFVDAPSTNVGGSSVAAVGTALLFC